VSAPVPPLAWMVWLYPGKFTVQLGSALVVMVTWEFDGDCVPLGGASGAEGVGLPSPGR